MKKISESIQNSKFLIFVFLILAFFVIQIILLFIGVKLADSREDELGQLKMDAMMDIVSESNATRQIADENFSANLKASVRMMSELLKEFVTEGGYSGPRVFADAFVAELRDDQVILPEEYQEYASQITRDLIIESIGSGEMMTGQLMTDSAKQIPVEQSESITSEEAYADMLSRSYFLSFGEISKNCYYVDLMTEIEYTEYLERYASRIYESLEEANKSFEGITLVLREQDGELELLRQYGKPGSFENLSDLGLTDEILHQESSLLTVDGRDYLCSCSQPDANWYGGEELFIVQLIPKSSLSEQHITQVLLVSIVMLIIFAAVAVYIFAVQRYLAEHVLSEEQAVKYHPRRMRKRMFTIGLICILVSASVALLIESVGQLYMEFRYARDALRIFSSQLEKENQDQLERVTAEEEAWFVYYGEELASLLSDYPELAAREKLQACCDILGIDYIMLFDAKGAQTVCSREYVGFTLGNGQEDELYDFRRLLHGVPGIVHEPSVDTMTGLERQLVGVIMRLPSKNGYFGALIMALMPDQTSKASHVLDSLRPLSFLAAEGTDCFAADSSTGVIDYASDKTMIGKTVTECGLTEKSLRDGYIDFASVGGTSHLVITNREGDYVYYYAVESGTMFRPIFHYALVVAVLCSVVIGLLLGFFLKRYNEKSFDDWVALRPEDLMAGNHNAKGLDGRKIRLPKSEETDGKKQQFLKNLGRMFRWNERQPEEKAGLILHLGIFLLLLLCLDVLLGKDLINENYDSMLGFLLYGNWMRGLNLFSLCCILLLVSMTYLLNVVCSWLLQLLDGILSKHGETIGRLICSCIRYVTVFCVFYFGFAYLGFPTSTIVASLGIVSLALSLGAKDLIADILVGIAIVFEESMHVGDIVEINGTRGTVLEIGVRATKLRVPVNNILIISNHNIEDILNLSKEFSQGKVEFRVSSNTSLSELEDILNRELPEIGKRNEKIVFGPYLVGVTVLNKNDAGFPHTAGMSLAVAAMCEQKNTYEVTLYLNRELKLLFEREGIRLI